MRKSFFDFLETFGGWMFEFLSWCFGMLPRRARYPLISALGQVFGLFAWNMRSALDENLNLFFVGDRKRQRPSTWKVFSNFAIALGDFFLPDDVIVHVPQRKKLEKLREQHPGILVLTFHLGHWELGARTMKQWGWPVTAVYQPYRNKRLKKSIESRRAPGVNFIAVGGNAANGVRAALRRGDVVAMLGDHPFGEDGAEVNLLGHKVIWPKGPVVLAMKEKAPIVVAVVVRTGVGEYTAHIEDPIVSSARGRNEVNRLVQEIADKFAAFLIRNPAQWYRFLPFEFVN